MCATMHDVIFGKFIMDYDAYQSVWVAFMWNTSKISLRAYKAMRDVSEASQYFRGGAASLVFK